MLGDRPAHVAAQLERAEPVPVDLRAQVPVEIRQHPVAGRVEEHEVERGVRLEEALDVSEAAQADMSSIARSRAATSSAVSFGTARRDAIVSSASRTW